MIEGLRRLALSNTTLATASPNRIRLTLLKIGAVVLRNTRRIRLLLSSACPASGTVLYRRRPPRHLLTTAECCPGTLTNNGGWGRCLRNPQIGPDQPIMTITTRLIPC